MFSDFFLCLQTSQKIFLLSSRKPRTSCSSLNWLHGSPTMVQLQEKSRNKIYILILKESGEGHISILNQPLFVSSCPPRWVSLIHLLLHPKNCQQILIQPLPCKNRICLHKLSDLYRGTVTIYCSPDALKLHENGFAHIKSLLPAAPALYSVYLPCSYQNVGFGVFLVYEHLEYKKEIHDLFMHLRVYR